ncbi:hypothetical protein GMJLKIPL_6660 [Methylobacterium isbiliense]|uniref:Uncharacterized protein n=1 Tax=Methylobacterium isbiliense TaxID=315478 RepID=A0ABQ4SN88_9HYPH|nr:hypothetical protein GMJLKIPL_6660 [Methylobacterium isbiliense]
MPRIVDRLVAAEAPRVGGDGLAREEDGDPVSVGAHLHVLAGSSGGHRVAVVVEAHEAGLGGDDLDLVEAVEPAPVGDQGRPLLRLEHLLHGAVLLHRVSGRARPGPATLLQPVIEVVEALEAGDRLEEAVAGGAHLVLDLPLLPARTRIAGGGLDEVVRAQLQEAAVEGAGASHEDGGDGRAHVVVDAAPAGTAEEAEGALVAVEDHLLGLARVGAQQEVAAMAEPDVGDLDLDSDAREPGALMAPVELVSLPWGEGERDEQALQARRPLREPSLGIAAHGIVAARIAFVSEVLEHAHVAQALTLGLGEFLGEQEVEASDVAVELRPRLVLALVGEGCLVRAQRLAHDLAREAQLARDLADALMLVAVKAPDLGEGLHDQHPRLAPCP